MIPFKSLYSFIYPIPRVVYAMASDRVIYHCLSYVMPKFKTPVIAIICIGLFSATLALLLDLSELINLTSIGTLLAYALVSSCNLVLRYRPFENSVAQPELNKEKDTFLEFMIGKDEARDGILRRLFNPTIKKCTKASSQLTNVVIILDGIITNIFAQFSFSFI